MPEGAVRVREGAVKVLDAAREWECERRLISGKKRKDLQQVLEHNSRQERS
jgi:hypothetical protein